MPPKYWHVRGINLRPRANEAFLFPPMRKPLPSSSKDQMSSMLLQVIFAVGRAITQPTKRGAVLDVGVRSVALKPYHCVEAAGGVAVRRGPLPFSFHLRLPTRVSRCDGMTLLSCPAVTIMLLCLFRYASTDRYVNASRLCGEILQLTCSL
jgi:hypothetical protein